MEKREMRPKFEFDPELIFWVVVMMAAQGAGLWLMGQIINGQIKLPWQ